jgi:hypothetical protein
MNNVPWCAIFTSLMQAKVFGKNKGVAVWSPSTPASVTWWKAHHKWHSQPKAGDLGYVTGSGGVHHVFMVEKVLSKSSVQTLEGNTNNDGSSNGNGVYRRVRTYGAGSTTAGFGRACE